MPHGDPGDGRYRVIGPMEGGDALRAVRTDTGTEWVLKPKDGFDSPEVVELLKVIRHPGLPRVFDEVECDGRRHLVQELLEGDSLGRVLARSGGALDPGMAVRYAAQAARILSFLHNQGDRCLLHLDIKPDNLLLDPNGRICLVDFGAARVLPDPANPDAPRPVHGTPGYAAPELLSGNPPGVPCDLYSLGATLFRLLGGTVGTGPLDPADLGADLSPVVRGILGRCLMTRPGDRYRTAAALASDLEGAADMLARESGRSAGADPVRRTRPEDATPEDRLGEDPDRLLVDGERTPLSLLCVLDGPAFGCELAAALAARGETVLVVDADLLNPRADDLLGVDGGRPGRPDPDADRGSGGLDEAIGHQARQRLGVESLRLSARRTAVEGVRALAGTYRLEDYPYYSTDDLAAILRTARLAYDRVVVLVGPFPHDAFTCLSLVLADRILVPLPGSLPEFRRRNRLTAFLGARHGLEPDRIRYIAFEYDARYDLGPGLMDELCGGRLAGVVHAEPRRRERAGGRVPFAAGPDPRTVRAYEAILRRLAIGRTGRPAAVRGGAGTRGGAGAEKPAARRARRPWRLRWRRLRTEGSPCR